ncbi:hypothetical protein OEZ86_011039 [Tetradesmus obliquus]|nr:hypothetical protein OEZ86_011039 [Tetradesmus obliquus]
MPRDTAQTRVRSGRLDSTTVTIDRPETEVRGTNGNLFTLPRRPADAGVVVYHKVNGKVVDPRTGQRMRPGQRHMAAARPHTLSFGTVALTAFIGFRVCQLLRRCFKPKPCPEEQQLLLLQQQLELEQQQQQQLPPVRVFPAMLQRALPQLGPPSRVKRVAQAHRNRQRRLPNAQQKMQQRGVVQRRVTTLEKWDNAAKQQARALMVQEQQQGEGAPASLQQLDCGRSMLPLPGLPGSSMLPPQPLLESHSTKDVSLGEAALKARCRGGGPISSSRRSGLITARMARYEREDMCPDDDDSEDEMGPAQHKAKPRRKSHQRPQGSDQIRQAFSKRKKGLVLKAYQLNALTDAKVFMFITNDKGTSWAYATPGFSSSLDADLLKQLRSLAHVPESAKLITEVMPDPSNAKQPADTAAADEHAAPHRADQVPVGVPPMRAAAGNGPARTRSSYSGDGAPAGACNDRVPLARSGSTTTNTRAQSLAQSEELPHTKQQHARPPSGSSMAGGARPNSAAAAAHNHAPAGPAGASGRPSQWIEFESKPDNLRQMSETGCYASSSGYSSYGASPSCNANAQRASTSSPIDGQAASPAVAAAGSGPSSAAASMLLAREAASADPSPTAALSSQLCSLLAMDSPMHEGPVPADQQQQLGGWQEQGRGAEASAQQGASVHDASNQQQQQQQHNQGAYIPRTDDLVSDPLMEMLMDQAMAGGSRSRPGSSGGQHHQHMSIMEATLQQEQQQQQQPAMQVLYYGSNAQQHQQQQQLGQYGQPQYRQQPQVQHSMPIPISRGAQQQQQQQQPEQQQQLLQLSGLLQHFPLPPKSDADKPAWQEHVRQVLLSLQLQPQQQQQLMALIRDRGGKQRHGPSRLSATSPAIDAAAAAGMDAPGMPSNMQGMQGSILGYVGQSGQSGTGSMAMYQHQQQMGGGEASAMPANCMSMSVPVLVPMSMAAAVSAGYCVQQGMQQQMCSSGGMAAAAGGYGCMPQQQHPASSAPGSLLADLQQQQQQQQQQQRTGMAACSSPLKRSQPCSGPFGLAASSAAAFSEAGAEAMSPLKRACRELPEPPSFATLLQTELGEDDAVAWAASAAANDSVKMAGNMQPCDSFLKFDSLGKVGSGSLPTFVTVGGGEAAAAQMAAAYAAAAAAGEGEGAGDGAAAAGGGCDDDAEDDGSMLQAVLAQAVDEGDCDGGCVLDDCDTEMGDVAAGSAAAVAPPDAGDAAAAAAADELQQCAVVDGGVAAQGAM